MLILNLGCGTKTSQDPRVINIDLSFYLRLRKRPVLASVAKPFLSSERKEKLKSVPSNVLVHDLRKGIPFPSNSVDVVYHSHFLEYIERGAVPGFFSEVRRVMKPDGFHRIVVPDFEVLCRNYIDHILACTLRSEMKVHEQYIANVIEQCVRQESAGSEAQKGFSRLVDRLLLGDARKRGETHRWMYDSVTLTHLLEEGDFRETRKLDWDSSSIPDWEFLGLDRDAAGQQYKHQSLYIEAKK